MSKLGKDIPLWTWYNGQLLQTLDQKLKSCPQMSVKEFFDEFLTEQEIQGMGFYQPMNQGSIFILLYGLMVVPKELWEKESTNFQFKTKPKFKLNPQTKVDVNTLDL